MDEKPAKPVPITRQSHHDKVLELFRTFPKGKVLDVPSGHGALTEKLIDLGFDVSCSDIDPGLFLVKGVEIRKGDLSKSIPYDSGTFDHVASIAGLHRLTHPGVAIREFHRVLKPGGTLVLSFPNYAHLRRRVKFLLKGYISSATTHERHRQTIDDPEAHFRNILLYPTVKRHLGEAGFKVRSLHVDKHRTVWYLFPLILLIRFLGLFASSEARAQDALAEASSSSILTGGNNLIILAEKAAAAPPP